MPRFCVPSNTASVPSQCPQLHCKFLIMHTAACLQFDSEQCQLKAIQLPHPARAQSKSSNQPPRGTGIPHASPTAT